MAPKKKRTLTKFEQAGIAAVIIIAGMYLYIVKMHTPMMATRDRAQKEYNKLQAEMKQLTENPPNVAVLKARKRLLDEVRDEKARLEKARQCIAKPDEVIPIRMKVMDTAVRCKLRKVAGTPDKAEPVPAKMKTPFSIGERTSHPIVLSGSFKNVVAFLDCLGRMEKKVWAESISISLRDEDGRLTLSMLLRI